MAVWIALRIAQFGRDSVLELLRYEVLQTLGFFVDLIPSVV